VPRPRTRLAPGHVHVHRTSVTWNRRTLDEEGIARVFLDGKLRSRGRYVFPTKEVQVPLFTALTSPIPAIQLTIEVTGRKNVARQFLHSCSWTRSTCPP